MRINYTYKAKLKRVIDGDTIDVIVDLGFSTYTEQRLRLLEIDAPEMRGAESAEGKESKAFIEQLLKRGEIVIQSEKMGGFRRYLARVWAGGCEVNAEMIKTGHAQKYEK